MFRTPPTPGIYDVWYRYVEGSDIVLHEKLEHAVTVSKLVSKELLEFCHQQMIAELSGAENLEALSNRLAYEIASLTSLLSMQLKATVCIDEEVHSVAAAIQYLAPTPQMIRSYVERLVASNEAMRTQLASTREQLEQSQTQVNELQTNLFESQKALLTDSLTGIGNRRFCQSAMKHAVMQRLDDRALTYLMLIDVDKLRSINES